MTCEASGDDWWSSLFSPLCVSDKPGSAAAHSKTSWVNLNCVMFIDESAQCWWDRGGALSQAERWNAPIEENTDGQPSSAARRPVPRHGMSIKRKQPKRKCSDGRKGKRRRVSQTISSRFSLERLWCGFRKRAYWTLTWFFQLSELCYLFKLSGR